jgi:hypothetical protein
MTYHIALMAEVLAAVLATEMFLLAGVCANMDVHRTLMAELVAAVLAAEWLLLTDLTGVCANMTYHIALPAELLAAVLATERFLLLRHDRVRRTIRFRGNGRLRLLDCGLLQHERVRRTSRLRNNGRLRLLDFGLLRHDLYPNNSRIRLLFRRPPRDYVRDHSIISIMILDLAHHIHPGSFSSSIDAEFYGMVLWYSLWRKINLGSDSPRESVF